MLLFDTAARRRCVEWRFVARRGHCWRGQAAVKYEPVNIQFSEMKSDRRTSSSKENTISINMVRAHSGHASRGSRPTGVEAGTGIRSPRRPPLASPGSESSQPCAHSCDGTRSLALTRAARAMHGGASHHPGQRACAAKGRNTILLYNMDDPDNPVELAFQVSRAINSVLV